MRKLSLLAAAAMVAGGSAFAMDGGGVSISGEANFGVKYNEANDTPTSNALAFHHEFDITFAASGTTDGGIGFGAEVTIDNTESVTTAMNPASAKARLSAVRRVAADDDSNAARQVGVFGDGPLILGDTTVVGKDHKGPLNTGQVARPTTAETGDYVYRVKKGVIAVIDADDIAADNTSTDKSWVWVNAATGARLTAAEIAATDDTNNNALVYIGNNPGLLPKDTTAASVITSAPKAKSTVDNHGEVYISMDMHKLTIGSDLDAADKVAGGLADPGFDGIGIDDVAEGVWGKSAADVRYDGDFGVASVAISYGDNKGDAEWAAGFSFNVEPVTIGAGFDNHGVMSIGMGFTQGQIAMNALYSTDSDHDEADNEANKDHSNAGGWDKPIVGNKMGLKNQAMGVDVTYKMSDTTSLVLVAAQHKKENVDVSIATATGGGIDIEDGSGNDAVAIGTNSQVKGKWIKKSTTVDAFGVGFSHDLGGGATLKAGAGSVDSNAVADLGITMKF